LNINRHVGAAFLLVGTVGAVVAFASYNDLSFDYDASVEVVNEDLGPGMPRTVPIVNGTFADTFQGEDVHIYKFTKPARFGE